VSGKVVSVARSFVSDYLFASPHFQVTYEFGGRRWRGTIIADDELDAWRRFQTKLDEDGDEFPANKVGAD
jgi:hypothetical protein